MEIVIPPEIEDKKNAEKLPKNIAFMENKEKLKIPPLKIEVQSASQ